MAKDEPDADFIAFITDRMLWLRRVAFALCQDWHEADDLAQTSIAKFYTRWPRIRSTDNLDGYLRTIVVNTYLSARRGPWWRRVTLHHPPTEAPSFDPDITTRAELRDALAAIPPRQRAAIVLRFYCDLTVEQTAHELGCSPGTVKSQTSRGLAALRRIMESAPAVHKGA